MSKLKNIGNFCVFKFGRKVKILVEINDLFFFKVCYYFFLEDDDYEFFLCFLFCLIVCRCKMF